MKWTIIPLVAVAALAIPTMLGFVPVFIGVPAMLLVVILKDVIFAVFARGLPMAIISARMMGGLLWGVVKKTGEIVIDKFTPEAGMVLTKKHGAFNVMPERIYRVGGVPIGFAPENVGYNVGFDHVQLVKELKRRGIEEIREVADVNRYDQILGLKDDPRIKDLKLKFKAPAGQIDLSGFHDFYRYCAEAANPYHQDANIKLGIAQASYAKKSEHTGLLIGVGVMVFLIIIGLVVLSMFTGGGGGEVIVENAGGGGAVIPA